MGTTKDAMQAGSITSCFVVAIEGYKYLLTNHGSASAVAAAWAATDWNDKTNVLAGCLYVDLRNTQQLHPWEPFQSGGTCQLSVVAEVGEQLAIDLAKTAALPIAAITASVNRTATTINVDNTTNFAASGEAFIGNECFEYSSLGATQFNVTTRGKYSPFGLTVGGGTRFARRASVGVLDQYSTSRLPIVAQFRRTWEGAWCGVWEHRVVGGVLDTRAQAQLVFAGQIADLGEDESGASTINLKHLLDVISSSSIFFDQYSATLERGVYVTAGDIITFTELVTTGAALPSFANVLQVAAVASLPGTIAAGLYSAEQLVNYINASFASLYAAGTLDGVHSLTLVGDQIYETHEFPTLSATDAVYVEMSGTGPWISFLGGESVLSPGGVFISELFEHALLHKAETTFALPNQVSPVEISTALTAPINVLEQQGTFIDNSGILMPAEYLAYKNGANPVGFFLLDNKTLITGRIAGGQLVDAQYVLGYSLNPVFPPSLLPKATGSSIKQVWLMTNAWWKVVMYLLGSTGDVGYNTALYDVLPYGLGLEIPNELLTGPGGVARIIDDLFSMAAGGTMTTIRLKKSTRIAELLTVDCVLRASFPIWKDNALRFATWQTPNASIATLTLDEDNKAEPANSGTAHRAIASVDPTWAKAIVKIQIDYDWIGDSFAQDIVLYDRISLDAGGRAPVTLSWKNAGQGNSAADHAVELTSFFEPIWHTYFARPMTRVKRSIDQRYFEGYAPGDVAVLTDGNARDPATGIRGVVARPALLIRHSYSPGGAQPRVDGKPTTDSQVGEVELFVEPDNRSTIWAPAAEVDETANTGGFTAGYNGGLTLRTKTHVHSEASEPFDAANFAIGDVIWITECDPAMATAPDRWQRTITAVAGTDIAINSALASPAFSATRRYRITSADYASAVTSQRTDAYQADDADGLIENLAPPYQYAIAGPSIAATLLTHVELAELDPTGVCAGDGVPFDTGYGLALAKTANNLVDHKTAIQNPGLSTTAMVYTGGVGSPTYRLRETRRRFFGRGQLGAVGRSVAVAPWMRSTVGSSSVRVTISKYRPSVDTTSGATNFGPNYASVVFTSATATWGAAAEQLLDLASVDGLGNAWVSIEVTANAQTRGLAQCIVRERV